MHNKIREDLYERLWSLCFCLQYMDSDLVDECITEMLCAMDISIFEMDQSFQLYHDVLSEHTCLTQVCEDRQITWVDLLSVHISELAQAEAESLAEMQVERQWS